MGTFFYQRKRLRTAVIAALLLSGCSSINGAPKRIISVSDSMDLLSSYKLNTAITNFNDGDDTKRGGMTKVQYRNMVAALYLNAIDARYYDFRRAIAREGRQSGLGLDIAILGLTTGASVAKDSIVNELSAGAAALTGTRGAIDRNLYFEKALPALLSAMDAERLKVRTQIVLNLRKSAAEYPLETVIGDLNAYEMAGSMDRAVEQVTSDSASDRQDAKLQYENAVRACDGEEDIAQNIHKIMQFTVQRKTANDLTSLQAQATIMGLNVPGDVNTATDAIRKDLLANYCTNAKLEELIANIKNTAWGSGI